MLDHPLKDIIAQIDGSAQDCSNSIANTLELVQFSTKSSR